MNETLDKLLGLADAQAHLVLLGLREPQLAPCWVFIQPDGSSRVLGTPFTNDAQKEATIAYVIAWMRNHGTVAYSFMCEAWAATLGPEEWSPGSGKPIPEADRPINRVDRREVILAMATDGAETEHRQWQIVRGWQGEVVGLTPLDMAESEVSPKSRFAGLLHCK
jgi:hypothetical protein